MKLQLLAVTVIVSAVVFFVFVTGEESQPVSYADSIFESCYDDDECTIDMLYDMSQNNSTQTILLTIDDLVDLYSNADFYCHPIAHHLGEFLFGYVGRDLRLASDVSDYRCASGIMHGLVENSIQIENMLDGNPIESIDIKESCNTIEDALGYDAKVECIHGMGHSLIKVYDYDTIQTLERCNEFETWAEIYMCNGGVFMQNMGEYAKKEKGDFDSNDLYYPCNQINGTANHEAATLCYRYQANYFLVQTDYDLQSAYSLCSGIEDSRFIAICYKGVAAHLTKNTSDAVNDAQIMCSSTPTEYQKSCVVGAIESLTRFVSDEKAEEFCQKLDGDLQITCQDRMRSLVDSRYD